MHYTLKILKGHGDRHAEMSLPCILTWSLLFQLHYRSTYWRYHFGSGLHFFHTVLSSFSRVRRRKEAVGSNPFTRWILAYRDAIFHFDWSSFLSIVILHVSVHSHKAYYILTEHDFKSLGTQFDCKTEIFSIIVIRWILLKICDKKPWNLRKWFLLSSFKIRLPSSVHVTLH